MEFFLDSADVQEIKEFAETGLIDGVTTNPSLIAKSGRKIIEVIAEICDIISGPVSAEVTATTKDEMISEGLRLAKIASNIAIKVPLTVDGLKACKALSSEGHKVNVTLCFTASQALLAAKSGATFISPFIGRLDDISQTGRDLLIDIMDVYTNYPDLKTKILAASIRSPLHVIEAAKIGVDVVTLPAKVLKQMYQHPLTNSGLTAFLKDWQATGQSILKAS